MSEQEITFSVEVTARVLRKQNDDQWSQDVENLQRMLKPFEGAEEGAQPAPPLQVDGVFGPITEQRVKWFQGNEGLTADGVVGRRTWSLLLRYWAEGRNAG